MLKERVASYRCLRGRYATCVHKSGSWRRLEMIYNNSWPTATVKRYSDRSSYWRSRWQSTNACICLARQPRGQMDSRWAAKKNQDWYVYPADCDLHMWWLLWLVIVINCTMHRWMMNSVANYSLCTQYMPRHWLMMISIITEFLVKLMCDIYWKYYALNLLMLIIYGT